MKKFGGSFNYPLFINIVGKDFVKEADEKR